MALVAALTSLGNAMLIVGATGMACAIVATLLLPETAGRDLAALDCEPDPPRAAGESTLEVR